MEKERIQVSDADKLFYYFFSEEESCSILLNITLKTPVNSMTLKKAVNAAIKRYPNFCQTPRLDEEGFLYTVYNDLPCDVYPYDSEPVELGGRETNGYLFRVMHMGKKIWISVFHGVCDGKGLFMFARTLLYYYFTFSGKRIPNADNAILTAEVPADPTETADPFTYYPEINPSAKPAFKRREDNVVFSLPEEYRKVDQCEYHRKIQYVLNTAKVLKLAHEAETTLEAWFNLTVAKTIHDSYDTKGEMIMQMGAVDLRPFYESRYLQNMRELYWVPFIEPLFHISDKDAAMMARGVSMDLQLKKSHFDGVLYESKMAYKKTFNFPLADTESLKELRRGIWADMVNKVTFFTTNCGKFDLGPELDQFVTDAEICGPCIFAYPAFFLMTQGKKTTVNLVQRHSDRKLALKLLDRFRELGILVEYKDCGRIASDKVRPGKIEKEKKPRKRIEM